MPSGLVLLLILVIWAVALTPTAVRMYERRAPERTSRKFISGLTHLGHVHRYKTPVDVMLVRRPTKVAGIILDPHVDLHLDHGVDPFAAEEAAAEPIRRPTSARTIARRRRTVFLLSVITAAWATLAVLGVAPLVTLVMPLGMFTAYLFVIRRQVVARKSAAAQRATEALAAVTIADYLTEPVADMQPARRVLTPVPSGVASPDSRWMEQEQAAAVAGTYQDEMEELGLDDVVGAGSATPADQRKGSAVSSEQVYARVVNG